MNNGTILVVDDEPLNLEIVSRTLMLENFSVRTAINGTQALEILQASPEVFDAVLLDRMMPDMDGIAVLKRMRAHPSFKFLPVILQTAKVDSDSIIEGLQAGAYYYLTKPFDEIALLSVVRTAVQDYADHRALRQETREAQEVFKWLDSARFTLRRWADCRPLAKALGAACSDNPDLVPALWELLTNAVEHGCLKLGYAEKARYHSDARLLEEIQHREALPDNQGKQVSVAFERGADTLSISIADPGEGFDWHKYLELDPERVFDAHGRGILIARSVFGRLEYQGCGNKVTIHLSVAEGK